MQSYLARRLLAAGLTLFLLSFLIFYLGSLTGDAASQLATAGLQPGEEPTAEQIEAVRKQLGLDRPVMERYGVWVRDAIGGDLGRSLYNGLEVGRSIRLALPATVRLTATAMVFIVVLAVPFGVIAAVFHNRWPDALLRLLALAGASVPGFFLAYVLVYVMAVRLHLLPVAGMQGASSVILPALTLAVGPAAVVSRLLRSSTLEELGEPYVGTARAKGLSTTVVVLGHAARNAALPVLTVLGGVLGRLLEGTVIVEIVFSWPGLGRLAFNAIGGADYPVIQGTVLFAGVVYVIVNLAIDLSYSAIDPRVRLGGTQ